MKSLTLTRAANSLAVLSGLSLLPLPSFARAPDKSQYTLFNPTPDLELREFQSDRPDKTEGPYTVDAGHFQFETDLINISDNEEDGTRIRSTTAGATNLRLGLTQNTDAHLIIQPYTDVRVGSNSLNSGIGDTTLRMKWNLLGNDGGDMAFALIPYVVLPTAEDGLGAEAVEGGLILPLALGINDDMDLGTMLAWDKTSVSDSRYEDGLTASASLGYSLSDDLGVYGEIWAHQVLKKHEATEVTFDLGITCQVERYQIDAGVNIGLSEVADDLNPFLGLAGRI